MLASRMNHISPSGIRQIFDLAARMENPLDFSIGQPDFDTPEVIKEAAIAAIRRGCNRYTVTQGIESLRKRVRKEIEKSRSFTPGEVIITAGVSGGFLLAMLALVNPGDEVLMSDPYFVLYRHVVNMVGGIPTYYDLYPDFSLKPEEIQAQITDKTKVLIINTPANPTGMVYTCAAIQAVANIARQHDLVVVSDEIYDGFVYDESLTSISTFYPKTVLLSGFSKTYGIPGWRMGYAAGPSEILEAMTTLQQFTFVCAPTPAQYACLQALDLDVDAFRVDYRRKRDLIYQGLIEQGFEVCRPGGAFYIFPKAPWGTASDFCKTAIQSKALIIPGSAFSRRNTHFRISFATSEKQLAQGIALLGKLARQQ